MLDSTQSQNLNVNEELASCKWYCRDASFLLVSFLISPIILLDDIFHKLDDRKINVLVNYLLKEEFSQIFISDSIKDRLNEIKKIIKKIKIINIDKGKTYEE